MVVSSMASSEPYLTQVQKDNGVCLVDKMPQSLQLTTRETNNMCPYHQFVENE
jgi:hypothetical protein